MNFKKYQAFAPIALPNRTWPSKTITQAPIWCSVDLRDGNQSLPIPMDIDKKLRFYDLLVDMGYRQIEIGFPSASDTEFNFARRLIEENRIPDDVFIQVLTQSREHLIRRTFESLKGAKKAVVHLYNSTSIQQREIVFGMSKQEIIDIAIKGATLMVELAASQPETEFYFEYSPESFHATEIDYALEICEAVLDVWQPTPDKKAIINLPTTVEVSTPNVFADQVEWFCRHLTRRNCVQISVHPHNDRGTAIATAELAVMAGADRVEGTLFGNGERTGNVDMLTMAMNLFSQGIDPHIEFDSINDIIEVYEYCTELPVHQRHPYAGELVYTAFSGSHQDAIRKGLKAYDAQDSDIWEVPYLPIDPADLGRSYEPIIRINSQSGKGGVAYILEAAYDYKLPKVMHPEFGAIVKQVSDSAGKELMPSEILSLFKATYLDIPPTITLNKYRLETTIDSKLTIDATITINGEENVFTSTGNGPISAFFYGLCNHWFNGYTMSDYSEHALGDGADAEAVAYVKVTAPDGSSHFGVGTDSNIDTASMKAILSGLSRF
jgi:2-isopropylmalate synthase